MPEKISKLMEINKILKSYADQGSINREDLDFVSSQGCLFVHFNGDCFKDGLRTKNSTFLVHAYERDQLVLNTKELVLNKADFSQETFSALKAKLWWYFREYCDLTDSRIIIHDHLKTKHAIVKNYLNSKPTKMATRDEILEVLNDKWFFSTVSWDFIDPDKIKRRICAGQSEDGKSFYYYNGMITDISDYGFTSLKKYVIHVKKIEVNVSLANLSKNLYLMCPDFKIRTLISICHQLYGYDHNYYQFSSSVNLQFERLIFSELEAVKKEIKSSICVPKRFLKKVATSELLWMMKEIFEYNESNDEFQFHMNNCNFKTAMFSTNSNLILAFIYIFIKFFIDFDKIEAIGHNRIYHLERYKQTITIKKTISI